MILFLLGFYLLINLLYLHLLNKQLSQSQYILFQQYSKFTLHPTKKRLYLCSRPFAYIEKLFRKTFYRTNCIPICQSPLQFIASITNHDEDKANISIKMHITEAMPMNFIVDVHRRLSFFGFCILITLRYTNFIYFFTLSLYP